MRIIESYDEFIGIVGQDSLITNRDEVREQVKLFREDNENYSTFSIRDENNGSPSYITNGIGFANCIGYYVVAGDFAVKGIIEVN